MSRKLLVALALAAAPLLWVSAAHANLQVQYSINGGAFALLCSDVSGGSCSGSVTSGGITLTLQTATSNSPGTAAGANLLSAALSVTNTGTVDHTLELLIGDTGYTSPTAPPTLLFSSQVGGSIVTGGADNTLSFESCLDTANGQNVCPGTFTTPALTPAITADSSSYNASNSILILALASPYSMTEDLKLTLSGGSKLGYQGSTDLTPVPEPATVFLGGLGLIAFGYAARRRLFGR